MSESREELQVSSSNAIFASVKDTLSLGVGEMKRALIETFSGTKTQTSSDPNTPKNKYKKGQFTADLAKREDAVSHSRE